MWFKVFEFSVYLTKILIDINIERLTSQDYIYEMNLSLKFNPKLLVSRLFWLAFVGSFSIFMIIIHRKSELMLFKIKIWNISNISIFQSFKFFKFVQFLFWFVWVWITLQKFIDIFLIEDHKIWFWNYFIIIEWKKGNKLMKIIYIIS